MKNYNTELDRLRAIMRQDVGSKIEADHETGLI